MTSNPTPDAAMMERARGWMQRSFPGAKLFDNRAASLARLLIAVRDEGYRSGLTDAKEIAENMIDGVNTLANVVEAIDCQLKSPPRSAT